MRMHAPLRARLKKMALQSRLKGTFSHFVFISRLAPSTQIDEKTHGKTRVVHVSSTQHKKKSRYTSATPTLPAGRGDQDQANRRRGGCVHMHTPYFASLEQFAFVTHIQQHGGSSKYTRHRPQKKGSSLSCSAQTPFDKFIVHLCETGRRNTGISLRPGVL